MSNSSLVDYTKLSPHCTRPRNGKIRGISIHTMAGPGSVEGCGAVFQTSEASAHYGIGPDGRVGQYVREEDRAWCCEDPVDHQVVTIEVSSIQAYCEPYACTEAAYRRLIDLCVDICRRNGMEELVYTGDANGSLTIHKMFADTACPGPYLESRMEEIAETVSKNLKGY